MNKEKISMVLITLSGAFFLLAGGVGVFYFFVSESNYSTIPPFIFSTYIWIILGIGLIIGRTLVEKKSTFGPVLVLFLGVIGLIWGVILGSLNLFPNFPIEVDYFFIWEQIGFLVVCYIFCPACAIISGVIRLRKK